MANSTDIPELPDMTDELLPQKGKPLKAPNEVIPFDDRRIRYNLGMVSSPKLDGNRGLCIGPRLFTSSMKAPRNDRVWDFLEPLLNLATDSGLVFDYELYDPAATHHAQLSGTINSFDNKLPPTLQCCIFDTMRIDEFYTEATSKPFAVRLREYQMRIARLHQRYPSTKTSIIALPQRTVSTPKEAQELFERDLADGYEGSMLRATEIDKDANKLLGGWYKHGRATIQQSIIFKFKQFATVDAIIIDVHQRRKNVSSDATGNVTFELTDAIGALEVAYQDDQNNNHVTTIGFGKGFNLATRRKWWTRYCDDPTFLIGKRIEFTHMPHGAQQDGRCRHGMLKRFREDI